MVNVITRSPLISVFEKVKLRNFSNSLFTKDRQKLTDGLQELRHGDEQLGFDAQPEILQIRKLAKWSLMTILQAYDHPQRAVFMKPATAKGTIQYFELHHSHYYLTPTWSFYEGYRATSDHMKSKVDLSFLPVTLLLRDFSCVMITMKYTTSRYEQRQWN
jgi:hypothetical protein